MRPEGRLGDDGKDKFKSKEFLSPSIEVGKA